MKPIFPVIGALIALSACSVDPAARSRAFEREAAGFGFSIDADSYSPSQRAAARNIMYSDRSESEKRGLLRSQLSRRNGRLRDLF